MLFAERQGIPYIDFWAQSPEESRVFYGLVALDLVKEFPYNPAAGWQLTPLGRLLAYLLEDTNA